MVAIFVLCWTTAGTAPGEMRAPEAEDTPDALELLLELASENDPEPMTPDTHRTRVDSGAPGTEPGISRGYLELGALVLVTAEGNFPQTVLTADGELDITLFPNTALETVETVPAWETDELLRPGPDQLYPSLVLTALGEWSPTNRIVLRGFVTTGEIRGGSTLVPEAEESVVFLGTPAEEFWSEGLWLTEASATFYLEPWAIEFGRKLVSVADGLVYQDVGTGVFISGAWPHGSEAITLDAQLFAVGRNFDDLEKPSPFVSLAVGYEWGFVNTLELYAATFIDRSLAIDDVVSATRIEAVLRGDIDAELCGAAAQIARVSLEECRQFSITSIVLDDIGDRARLNYAGIRSTIQTGQFRLRWNAIASAGSYDFTVAEIENVRPERTNSVRLRGYGFDLDAYASITPTLGFGLLALGFSGLGDDDLSDGNTLRYSAFIGTAPLWDYSTIFFGSGVNQTFTAARTAAAGINGHGVYGIGPQLEWSPRDAFVELSVLALFAEQRIDSSLGRGGKFYGLESNIEGRYDLTTNMSLRALGGVLVPGDFFPEDALAYRAVVLVQGSVDL